MNAPVNGPHRVATPVHAFVNGTLHPSPGVAITGTLLVQENKVLALGDVKVPAGAVVHDMTGLHLWPSFIEPYSGLGMPAPVKGQQGASTSGARFWNPAIHPSVQAAALYNADPEAEKKLRDQGFGMVITHVRNGIARGTSAAVSLSGANTATAVVVPNVAAHFSFRKGDSPERYPSSEMGAIALLRQTLLDAQWYAEGGSREQSDIELEALNGSHALPWVFEAEGRNDVLRVHRVAAEFRLRPVVKGSGDEYARLSEIAAAGHSMIIPLLNPETPDVEDPFDALEVDLARMLHWERAPHNPRLLAGAGVPFAFTTDGLKDPAELWPALRRAVRCGLDSSLAIAAFTTIPAELFGLSDRCGSLARGMRAHLFITSDHLLAEENIILETWVGGVPFVVKDRRAEDLRGTYDLNLRSSILGMEVKGTAASPEVHVFRPENDTLKVKAEFKRQGDVVTVVFVGDKLGVSGAVRLNGVIHRGGTIWDGQGQMPSGEWFGWSSILRAGAKKDPIANAKEERTKGGPALDSVFMDLPANMPVPLTAYGRVGTPDSATLFIRHATVWTNGPEGILGDADVMVHEGRMLAVGKGLRIEEVFPGKKRPEVREIDGTGKHLTCGIIDEHSHIAIDRGVNEGTQAVTSEVRIGDVIDPDDVNIYRDLAGGVTTVQLLHGSANPIGGQSALIKLRWGADAEGMKVEGAPGHIKFALGENVKQSNWSNAGSRFPQTRMGVEQVMYDAFHRARTYKEEWRLWDSAKSSGKKGDGPLGAPSPRRDLELEALAQILDGERFITCHSYVQSEIAMLMHVADSMGFRVNTFTHILEGYKVADRMKSHGVSASTFSDWWAYKYEVNEAIPFNAALLWEQGVNTGINSDNAEMSRRLNQEAAKAVKYGGVPEEEAWKMVTLNPARMLHLDHRMGSVEKGKDADLVLWSGPPLSIGSRALITLVDGTVRFDHEEDARMRTEIANERARCIAKMLAAKKAGARVERTGRKERTLWHCDTEGDGR